MSTHLFETVDELMEWLEGMDCTVQISFRTRLKPPYLVRIRKKVGEDYLQAVGDTIHEAVERCFEVYLTDDPVPEDLAGRTGQGGWGHDMREKEEKGCPDRTPKT